jgi:hypothetical protein
MGDLLKLRAQQVRRQLLIDHFSTTTATTTASTAPR